MKIALVTETYPPEVNGVAHTLWAWVTALRKRGHCLDLIRPRPRGKPQPPPSDELWVRGLPLPRYPTLQFGLPAFWALYRRWRVQRPDLVHIATEGPLGLAALLVAHYLKIPVTTSFHTHFHHYMAYYRVEWLHKLTLDYLRVFHNAAAATFVPTAQLRDSLIQLGFSRLAIVGRGIDTHRFHPRHRDPQLRARWGASPETPVILWVSRLAPEKNLTLFFEAVAAMRSLRPDIVAVVVGDGPLAATARSHQPQIHFAGERTGEDLAAHYASADLFLFPSLTETYGNVVLEAMASGLAVVAFDDAAAHELIRTGENGVVVPVGDCAAFIQAACWLISHCDEIARLGRAAHASVSSRDWEAIAVLLERQFAALLAPLPSLGVSA